jgi:cyclohexanecarboxylate-CoA ligase
LIGAAPAAREVAIVAMPDPRLGERSCAYVVSTAAGRLDLAGMRWLLDDARVAKQYWPERLEVIDALPRTQTGKVRKFELRHLVAVAIQDEANGAGIEQRARFVLPQVAGDINVALRRDL